MVNRLAYIPCLCFLWCSGGVAQNEPIQSNPSRFLASLPPDTESVYVVTREYRMPDRNIPREDPSWPFVDGSLQSIDRSSDACAVLDALAGAKVRLSVTGARRFRRPAGLGLVHFEGATFLYLENPDVGKLIRNLGGPALRSPNGLRRLSAGNNKSVFIANPFPHVVLIATDASYVDATIQRLRKGEVEAPSWLNSATRTTDVWGARRFFGDPEGRLSYGDLRSRENSPIPCVDKK